MKKKILIADDEPDIARTVSLMLETEGYETIVAGDGPSAIDQAYIHCPDLIILDVVLPFLDGITVASRLKNDPQFKRVPVILITAQMQKRDQELIEKSAVEFYLSKPFDIDLLKDRIVNLLASPEE